MQTLVSTKYQVVIPKIIRKKINLKPGQRLNVDIVGEKVVLAKVHAKEELKWPEGYYQKLRGIWKSSQEIDKYLEEEDRSWG